MEQPLALADPEGDKVSLLDVGREARSVPDRKAMPLRVVFLQHILDVRQLLRRQLRWPAGLLLRPQRIESVLIHRLHPQRDGVLAVAAAGAQEGWGQAAEHQVHDLHLVVELRIVRRRCDHLPLRKQKGRVGLVLACGHAVLSWPEYSMLMSRSSSTNINVAYYNLLLEG